VNRVRRIWRVAWRFVVCALLLLWIFHSIFLNEAQSAWQRRGEDWSQLSAAGKRHAAWEVGPAELWNTLTLVKPGWLGLSFVCVGATVLIGILRWRKVLSAAGLHLPFMRALEISLVAHFFNSFLLGSTGGDLLKAYYAARETHHQKTEAVVTVFADRLIGLFSMLLFAITLILGHLHLVMHHRPLAGASLLIAAMLLACGGLIGLAFWGGLSNAWPRARTWLRSLPKGELLDRTLNACRVFGRNHRVLGSALGLSMLLNVVCVLQFAALARGLGLEVSLWRWFLVVPVVICIAALPITPSGLGLRENLFVVLLAHPLIGVPATAALSLSLLAFAGSLAWSLVGGLVYLTFRERHQLAATTNEPGV
jgi:glycosyltransferase 2 family protein